MSPLDLVTGFLLVLGAFFFVAGTVGIIRFPDTLTRLHAVTKADNLGLGLVVLALIFQADSLAATLKLLLIWGLILLASATSCIVVADVAYSGEPEESE